MNFSNPQLFVVILLCFLALVPVAPFVLFLVLDFLLLPLQAHWRLGGAHFDTSDLAILGMFLALIVRSKSSLRATVRQIPHFGLWVTMFILLTISFFATPLWHEHTPVPRDYSNPLALIFQLYRYQWKTILYFPIALIALNGTSRFPALLVAILATADICAAMGIRDALRGVEIVGPFSAPNGLGGALVAPLIMALVLALYPLNRWHRLFALASLLVIGRAAVYSSSRGAMVATVAGATFVGMLALTSTDTRRRLLRLVPMFALIGALVMVVKPNLFDRPNIRHALTASKPLEQSTMQWRLQQRWPHFTRKAFEKPFFGTGTDWDDSLEGLRAKQPHNSYLSIAVTWGLPVLICYLLFALLALHGSIRAVRHGASPEQRILGLVVAGALVGILVHGLIDRSLLLHLVTKLFWVLAAVGCSLRIFARVEQDSPQRVAVAREPGRPLDLAGASAKP